jgi:hypothetical protein
MITFSVARRALSLLLPVVLVASCSGSDEPAGTTDAGNQTTTTASSGSEQPSGEAGSEADLVQAATDAFEAFTAADNEAWFNSLSSACRERLGFAAVEGYLDGRRFNMDLADIDPSALTVDDVSVNAGGSSASVMLTISGAGDATIGESLPHSWVYEAGAWHMDDCSDIGESQGGLAGYGTDRNDPIPYGGVTDANGWLVGLIYIAPDDEATVLDLGGDPAPDGAQLFVAQLSLGYNGAESSITVGDELQFDMVNGDTVYGADAACGLPPDLAIDPAATVGPGETVSGGFICRTIPPADADGMLLRVTHVPTGTEYWFDLTPQ